MYRVKMDKRSQCAHREQPGLRTMTAWRPRADQVLVSCAPSRPAAAGRSAGGKGEPDETRCKLTSVPVSPRTRGREI